MFHKDTKNTPQRAPIKRVIRSLIDSDVPAVMSIQRACYGSQLMEPASVYQRRLQSKGHCSLAATVNDELVAYLAAYWSQPGVVTPLHGDFQCYEQPTVLYLHDMAVAPHMAGYGLARSLLLTIKHMARERAIGLSALVSVQDSREYWQRHGYQIHTITDAQQAQNLASYGADAVYMVGKV